jgi:sulfur relay (sulfurtransferase) DsrF/TusC family protein
MGKKVLGIVETGYRATVEEQDDTILWLSSMFKGAGLDLTVLLRANAVNYAVRGQDASGLRFGDLEVTNPPRLDDDVAALLEKGVAVYYLAEDVGERGISEGDLVDGVKPVAQRDLPGLLDQFDQVWHW